MSVSVVEATCTVASVVEFTMDVTGFGDNVIDISAETKLPININPKIAENMVDIFFINSPECILSAPEYISVIFSTINDFGLLAVDFKLNKIKLAVCNFFIFSF